ncbi:uncharacterized protein JCM15063_000563 [Sporobolomyces koalae]|uniref:uncharacterized protein n=1 Tax=Sporobolomyces koalae TaxID=500713 RepID=UPI003176A2BE
MAESAPRPSQEELLQRWNALMHDPTLSFESIKRRAVEGALDNSIRSLCWRYFFGLLPSPSAFAASDAHSTYSTYSLHLAHQRSEYADLRERYLRAPDGGWIKDGENDNEVKSAREGSSESTGSLGKRPVKVDARINNPLGLEDDNPWQSWFADLELRKTIRQDVQRTFPEIDYFRLASTQNRMTDLLFIYTKLTPDIGYRQGMHELLAPILWKTDLDSLRRSNEPDNESLPHLVLSNEHIEHDTWSLFTALMKSCAPFYDHTATVALPRSPSQSRGSTGLGLSAVPVASSTATTLVQPIVATAAHLHSLIATLDPELHAAFTRLQVEPQLYAIRWLRLIFSREFPLSETLVLWDGIFARDPSLQITQHVAAAMLLRIRDSLIAAERTGGYGEFLQVLLRYPACPDGTFRTGLLLSQAVYLRDNLSHEGSLFVRRQNEELGITHAHSEVDEETDLRSAAARGQYGQRKASGASPAVGVGLLGEGGLVGDLAKGVYGRAEALGINKAILGTFNDIRRGVTAAQAQIEEQRQRQRAQFSQIPSRAPWEANSVLQSSARDTAADLARMRVSSAAMGEALGLCISVLERALSPPTPDLSGAQNLASTAKSASGAGSTPAPTSLSIAPQIMAITAMKHVRDVLGGQAKTFDPSVLTPLQQTLDLLNKSPPLPPLPIESPPLRPSSPPTATLHAPPSPAQTTSAEVHVSPSLRAPAPPPVHSKPTSSPSLLPSEVLESTRATGTITNYLGSRSERPLPMLTRTPQVAPVSPKPIDPLTSSGSSRAVSPLLTAYGGASPAPSSRSTSGWSSPHSPPKRIPSPPARSPFDPLGVL